MLIGFFYETKQPALSSHRHSLRLEVSLNRKHITGLALFIALISTSLSLNGQAELAQPDPDKPELWNRAVTAYAPAKDLIPQAMKITSHMLNSKGEIQSTSEQELRNSYTEAGVLQSEILRATDKGKDVTDKARAEQKKQQQKSKKNPGGRKRSMSVGYDEMPLALSRQSHVTVQMQDKTENIDGHSCRRFMFSMNANTEEDDQPVMIKGQIWIDEERGLPLKLEFAPDPLPSKVKSLQTVYTFQADTDGRWVVRKISINASGGILFIKKYFRSQIVLSDYFQKN